MLTFGIDVSSVNGTPLPPATAYDFVFVKATEGHTYVNPDHGAQVAEARRAGKIVGHYHFVWPGDIPGQVAHFLANVSLAAGDILALDWETTGSGTFATGAEKDQFLQLLKAQRPGFRSVLYCNRDFWLNHDTTSECGDGLWIADPSAPAGVPNVRHPWTFHQFGEAGGVDRNAYNGTDAQLRTWAHAVPVPPRPPVPKPPERKTYTVQNGDTLSGIAAAHGLTLARLEELNRQITNPNDIWPGQTVYLS